MDDEVDPNHPKKPYPVWARPECLKLALLDQAQQDPDEVFGEINLNSANIEGAHHHQPFNIKIKKCKMLLFLLY